MLVQRGRGWVFEEGGEVVGFSVADLETRSIWALFLYPQYERRGIGRALLDCAVQWLFARGAESIWLTTAAGSRAESLYRAAGWQATGITAKSEIRFELQRSS